MQSQELFHFLNALSNGILQTNNIPEIAMFLTGEKKALRFEGLNLEEFIKRGVLLFNWKSTYKDAVYVSMGNNWFQLYDTKDPILQRIEISNHKITPTKVYVISKNIEYSKKMLHAEFSNEDEAGHLLDYPECCVINNPIDQEREPWTFTLYDNAFNKNTTNFAQCNRLITEIGGISPTGEMFPCALDCKNAKKYSTKAINSLLNLNLKHIADEIIKRSQTSLYVLRSGEVRVTTKSSKKIDFIWTD